MGRWWKRKKSEDNGDVIIVNGQIQDPESVLQPALHFSEKTVISDAITEPVTDDKKQEDNTLSIKSSSDSNDEHSDIPDEELPVDKPDNSLPSKPHYQPCYLTDGNQSDLGLFIHFLEFHSKLSKRYRSDIMIDLNVWKKKLTGNIFDAEAIQTVLLQHRNRAAQYLASLKKYAEYRNIYGDNRLLVTIVTSQTIKVPKKSQPNEPDCLSKIQIDMYKTQAIKLCGLGKREGIWLGLFLLKINSSNISKLQYLNGSENQILFEIRSKQIAVDCPGWLMDAMKSIPETQWRLNRNTIRLNVREYGVSPRDITRSVKHHDLDFSK